MLCFDRGVAGEGIAQSFLRGSGQGDEQACSNSTCWSRKVEETSQDQPQSRWQRLVSRPMGFLRIN